MPMDEASGVHFELHGQGEPLLLGFPLMASQAEIFGEAGGFILQGFLDRLVDRYRVLVVDYPSIGRSRELPPEDFTLARACRDMLSVADAAGFDRFAWWSYASAAVTGMQLAATTDRITALAIGGWTPMQGPAAELLEGALNNVADPPASSMVILRRPEQYRQWVSFARSLLAWPETEAVSRIDCPRLAFAGEHADTDAGGVVLPYATRLEQHRAALEAMGWRVEIIPGAGHDVGLQPEIAGALLRDFLDQALTR